MCLERRQGGLAPIFPPLRFWRNAKNPLGKTVFSPLSPLQLAKRRTSKLNVTLNRYICSLSNASRSASGSENRISRALRHVVADSLPMGVRVSVVIADALLRARLFGSDLLSQQRMAFLLTRKCALRCTESGGRNLPLGAARHLLVSHGLIVAWEKIPGQIRGKIAYLEGIRLQCDISVVFSIWATE
jgi:hypothetical protein